MIFSSFASVLWPGHCAHVFCIALVFDKCWMVTGLVVSTVKTVVYFWTLYMYSLDMSRFTELLRNVVTQSLAPLLLLDNYVRIWGILH
jgi:hypothetical protein